MAAAFQVVKSTSKRYCADAGHAPSRHRGNSGPAPPPTHPSASPSARARRACPAAAPLAALVTVGVCEFSAAPVSPPTSPAAVPHARAGVTWAEAPTRTLAAEAGGRRGGYR